MKVKDYELKDDLLYDKDYGWIKIVGDIATLGVIEFGVKQTKEIAYVELPELGKKLKKGENYAVMEAAKWAGALKMPLSGEIIEVNEKLLDNPELLNKDPYGKGWIAKVKIENREEIKELMNVKKTAEWLKKEINTKEKK